jgi:hypothetical protein
MAEQRLMTLKEQLSYAPKLDELWAAGKEEDALELEKTLPMPSWLAKIIKEKVSGGADWLRQSGWNLAEVEAEFGSGWLDR